MPKRDRILSYFPYFYRASNSTKLLHGVVSDLAQPLEDADTHLFRIQRAHRLKVAENVNDIIKLAASLNLTAFHFEDILTDKSLSYPDKLDLMRSRVQRVARICLTGLGTPLAVLESAATFLNAEIVPEHSGDPPIKHLDNEYFSHKAVVEFTHRNEVQGRLDLSIQSELDSGNIVSEKLAAGLAASGIPVSNTATIFVSEKDTAWQLTDRSDGRVYTITKEGNDLNVRRKIRERIYLHESLFVRKKIEPAERWQMNSWIVENKNVEASPLKLVVQAVGDHTVRPSVFCQRTGEGLLFNGIVPEGKTLVVDSVNGASLDGAPVDDWVVFFKGGIFDFGKTDGATFVREWGDASTPFFGVMEDIVASPIQKHLLAPTVPIGNSDWFFKVGDGIYDGSDFDLSVFETLPDPVGAYDRDLAFDACVFDFPGAGVVGMGWDETIPCSFKLLLPPDASKDATKDSPALNYVSRVQAVLPSFKAAGVRAVVDTARDAWILGESVVRSSTAESGEGVELRATLLRNRNADRLVPLDSASNDVS